MLEKYRNAIYSCNRCGDCREMVRPSTGTYKVCPTREIFRFESYGGRGKNNIARAILEGRLRYTPKLAEHLYLGCLLCGNCREHCWASIDIPAITIEMRQEAVRLGLAPPEPLKEVDRNVEQKHNVFGEPPAKRIKWAEGLDLPTRGETLFFAGCYSSYRYPETAKATLEILKEADVDVAYLGEDEWCCGVPQFADGSVVILEEIAKHNVEAMKAAGARRVICSCPGCYHIIKSEYPKMFGKLPFEVIHISEIMAGLIKDGKIKPERSIGKRVTYHDPCHLGRDEGIYDAPREVLKSIPGLTLVEMQRNRENAWCCGGGSVYYTAFPDVAAKIAKTRIEEAEEVDAEAVITMCPLCAIVLTPAAKRAKMEIYDLPVLVRDAMKTIKQ